MSSETIFKIRLEGSDGKYYIVNLSDPGQLVWLQQKLGICSLKTRIEDLERKIMELEKPIRQEKILQLLKNEVSGRTEKWIRVRIPGFQYSDLSDLKAEMRINAFRVGNCWKYRLITYAYIPEAGH